MKIEDMTIETKSKIVLNILKSLCSYTELKLYAQEYKSYYFITNKPYYVFVYTKTQSLMLPVTQIDLCCDRLIFKLNIKKVCYLKYIINIDDIDLSLSFNCIKINENIKVPENYLQFAMLNYILNTDENVTCNGMFAKSYSYGNREFHIDISLKDNKLYDFIVIGENRIKYYNEDKLISEKPLIDTALECHLCELKYNDMNY